PMILLNTFIAAVWGGIAATTLKFVQQKYHDVSQMINGLLGGLVAVTASCHAVDPSQAMFIGIIGGLVVGVGDSVLNRLRIDDAIGVIPVHLFAGIWGTIAVALFADPQVLDNGLTSMQQLQSQLIGIGAVGLYSFGVAYLLFRLINRFYLLRVSEQSELIGLNVAEHRVSTEVFDLLSTMHRQQRDSELSTRVPAEPFTEVGQIAQQYNRVIDKVNDEIQQRDDAFSAFKQSEYRNGAIVEAAMDCIVTVNHRGETLQFNYAAENCFRVDRDIVNGQVFFRIFMTSDEDYQLAMQNLSQGFLAKDGLQLQQQNVTELKRYNKEVFPAELVITQSSSEENNQPEYTLHIRDVTQQLKLQNRLQTLAYKDSLTGLYNRAYFMENLECRIRHHQQAPGLVALMFLDLDQFKKVNDTLGHQTGDDLLCEISQRLTSITRDVDLVGRWGGDEFVVVMSGLLDSDNVIAKAVEILKVMRLPVNLAAHKLSVLVSIGIAISSRGEIDASKLMQHADLAMYDAKQSGRNTHRLFNQEMENTAQQNFRFEVALPEAMAKNQFFLHYQPKVTCDTNEIIGFEALIRWQHPEYGFISPGDFIPVIDGSSLINDVGEWVITEVVRQLVEWRKQGYRLLPIAVNISGHHLHSPTLVPFINNITGENNIASSLIEVEITEGVLTGNTEQSIAALSALKTTHIKLAIDDFGTGYSSLSYLKKFPVDILKIDRAFIIECASNSADAAICKTIISLAKSLGLQIVAEGVETAEQLKFLKQHDCDVYQGYYFSRPVAAEFIPPLLQQSEVG
ncbi:MAG: EAL domain-containing protein, partial [Immundisolibacteraceae bacterium]|nr:EAL domain-containing protein [Immundisolibacteraceae bacterium]